MRFQIIHLGNAYDFVVKDHKTNKTYGTFQGEHTSLKKCFEDITKEIEQLEIQIADLRYENRNLKSNLNSCQRERKQIKQTIQEAYKSERTQIGRNVLKQLLEAIQ